MAGDDRDGIGRACEPWRHHLGPPPPEGSPLAGVYGAGMRHAEHLLAELLGVEEYEPGEQCDDRDEEARRTLANVLAAAGIALPERAGGSNEPPF